MTNQPYAYDLDEAQIRRERRKAREIRVKPMVETTPGQGYLSLLQP